MLLYLAIRIIFTTIADSPCNTNTQNTHILEIWHNFPPNSPQNHSSVGAAIFLAESFLNQSHHLEPFNPMIAVTSLLAKFTMSLVIFTDKMCCSDGIGGFYFVNHMTKGNITVLNQHHELYFNFKSYIIM